MKLTNQETPTMTTPETGTDLMRRYESTMRAARDTSRPVYQRAAHARAAEMAARRIADFAAAAQAESLADCLEAILDETAIQ